MLRQSFNLFTLIALICAALALHSVSWAQNTASFGPSGVSGDEAIHQQLRALLRGVEESVNNKQYARLSQYFDANMYVTPSNQEALKSPNQIEPYFEKWFGPTRFLKSVHMSLTANELTHLNAAKDHGISTGVGREQYELNDGRSYDIPTRWTATVDKGEDGKWRIQTLHIGVDFTDNPLFNQSKAAIWRMTAIGSTVGIVLGLVVGLLIGFLVKRRRSGP